MNRKQDDAISFEGEEAGAGLAKPLLDLIAAIVLMALSVIAMIASYLLPAPGGLLTAPGLFPFLIAASLFVMAFVLGVTAVRRRSLANESDAEIVRDRSEHIAALLLAFAIAVYIAALHFLPFQYNTMIAGYHYTISAFEPVTVIVLATIIQVAWRGPLWITTIVSVVWTLILSVVFQKVFLIPLPGGF